MRLKPRARMKKPHKLQDNPKVYTEEQVAKAKRQITQRRRAIEDERIDREVEERLK